MSATKVRAAPRRRRNEQSEGRHQYSLFRWAFYEPVRGNDVPPGAKLRQYLVAIPNGGKRSPIEAKIMVGLGVTPGWPDTLLPLARGGWMGAVCELKKAVSEFRGPAEARDAVSLEQRRVLDMLAYAGWATNVSYGWDWARVFFQAYLAHRETNLIDPVHFQFGREGRTTIFGLWAVPTVWVGDESLVSVWPQKEPKKNAPGVA